MGLIYIIDMESSLADALTKRVIDMGQYIIFRKWDMNIDPRAEMEAYKNELKGLIISGSGRNINGTKKTPPNVPADILAMNIPTLAICYGMQYLAHLQGVPIVRCWDEQDPEKRTNKAAKQDQGEQGPVIAQKLNRSKLFAGLGERFPVWMKHNWMLESVPQGWTLTARTEKCPVAAMECGNIYAVQFHPEPATSLFGRVIMHNFLTYACGVETPYF